jgi:hypothetical protein
MPKTQSINVIAVGITNDIGWFRKDDKNPSGSDVHTNEGNISKGDCFSFTNSGALKLRRFATTVATTMHAITVNPISCLR